MRLPTSANAALTLLVLAACGGPETEGFDESAIDDGAYAEDAEALKNGCTVFKPASCRCRVIGGSQMSTAGQVIDPHVEGQTLFTYTIPGKCYNQQADWANAHFDRGCWKDCRDAFGIDGATRDPAVTALIHQAGRDLRALGACGGWHSAPLEFAAGTNRYRPAAAMGIGIGTGGTVVTVNGQKTCR